VIEGKEKDEHKDTENTGAQREGQYFREKAKSKEKDLPHPLLSS
jgi:hypothetical protein